MEGWARTDTRIGNTGYYDDPYGKQRKGNIIGQKKPQSPPLKRKSRRYNTLPKKWSPQYGRPPSELRS